jgi:hypothetical protein
VKRRQLAGIETETPLESEEDFIARIRGGAYRLFHLNLEEEE